MTVAVGREMYRLGAAPCTGLGLLWTSSELDSALVGPVAAFLYDDEGRAQIEEMFAGAGDADSFIHRLRELLPSPRHTEDWRVGEAIAAVWLQDHRDCYFPWPAQRDARSTGARPQGADLAGLGVDDKGGCLVFGEVKTSGEKKYPPRAVHGGGGLRQQLKTLRDRERERDALFQYLAARPLIKDWEENFLNACERYLRDKSDVRIYGVLIRDVRPRDNDLRSCVRTLAIDCPERTRMELLALYLPEGRIAGLGDALVAAGRDRRG